MRGKRTEPSPPFGTLAIYVFPQTVQVTLMLSSPYISSNNANPIMIIRTTTKNIASVESGSRLSSIFPHTVRPPPHIPYLCLAAFQKITLFAGKHISMGLVVIIQPLYCVSAIFTYIPVPLAFHVKFTFFFFYFTFNADFYGFPQTT